MTDKSSIGWNEGLLSTAYSKLIHTMLTQRQTKVTRPATLETAAHHASARDFRRARRTPWADPGLAIVELFTDFVRWIGFDNEWSD